MGGVEEKERNDKVKGMRKIVKNGVVCCGLVCRGLVELEGRVI